MYRVEILNAYLYKYFRQYYSFTEVWIDENNEEKGHEDRKWQTSTK
jgi:hypothetical protein